jgi:zinc transport system permease protein
MTIEAELTRVIGLFQLPFMQRALMGGVLTGLMGGLLGSFTILRQLSFFSDALGHSALLGISIGLLMGFNPSWVLLPFAVVFALVVTYFLERTQLWTDALLNIVYSSSLAIGIILLSFRDDYQGGISNILFGDILAVQTADLIFGALLLAVCVGVYWVNPAISNSADSPRTDGDCSGGQRLGPAHRIYCAAVPGSGHFH